MSCKGQVGEWGRSGGVRVRGPKIIKCARAHMILIRHWVRGRAPAEIKFSAFYPQNIAAGESKLSDFW